MILYIVLNILPFAENIWLEYWSFWFSWKERFEHNLSSIFTVSIMCTVFHKIKAKCSKKLFSVIPRTPHKTYTLILFFVAFHKPNQDFNFFTNCPKSTSVAISKAKKKIVTPSQCRGAMGPSVECSDGPSHAATPTLPTRHICLCSRKWWCRIRWIRANVHTQPWRPASVHRARLESSADAEVSWHWYGVCFLLSDCLENEKWNTVAFYWLGWAHTLIIPSLEYSNLI